MVESFDQEGERDGWGGGSRGATLRWNTIIVILDEVMEWLWSDKLDLYRSVYQE